MIKKLEKIIAALALTAALGLGSCAKDMPVESPAAAQQTPQQALQGSWDYRSTDGVDLSGYGITYSFNGAAWTYQLGDAGSKQFAIATTDAAFSATLQQNGTKSGEAIGSQIAGTYAVHGDTLQMTYDGHTALLVRTDSTNSPAAS